MTTSALCVRSATERFTVVDSLDPNRWNQFVDQHPKGSIFHTSYMMDVFKGAKDHCPLFLAALDSSGEVLALLVSVRIQTLAGFLGNMASRSIYYAEPLCREGPQGVEALAVLLAEHDTRMRKRALFAEVRPLRTPGAEKVSLERCGYRHEDYLNFLINLSQPKEVLWSRMSNSCRANIRRGHKHGVRVEDVTSDEGVEMLYHFLKMTYEHARVPLADRSLFAEAYRVLQPRNMLKIFAAYHHAKPVGACVVLLYKKTVYEWYWGVERTRSIYPAECITWHRIEWGHAQGYELYDFGGAGWLGKAYGVRDFKVKFGGDPVNYGRYRKIYSPWRFKIAETAYEKVRQLANPKHWVRSE